MNSGPIAMLYTAPTRAQKIYKDFTEELRQKNNDGLVPYDMYRILIPRMMGVDEDDNSNDTR